MKGGCAKEVVTFYPRLAVTAPLPSSVRTSIAVCGPVLCRLHLSKIRQLLDSWHEPRNRLLGPAEGLMFEGT